MEPYYLVFLFDENGRYPKVIAGSSDKKYIDDVYANYREMYGIRVQLRRIVKPSSIWAATLPV